MKTRRIAHQIYTHKTIQHPSPGRLSMATEQAQKHETASPILSRIPQFDEPQTPSTSKPRGWNGESGGFWQSVPEQDGDEYSPGEELGVMVKVKLEGNTTTVTPRSPFQRSWSPEPSSMLGVSPFAPRVSFGEDAPFPRWVVVEDIPIPNGSSNIAVQGTHDGEQSEVAAEDAVEDVGPKYGMAVLTWKFEGGPEEGWNGLTFDRLYVHAYRVLEESLSDAIARDRLRSMIWDSSLAPRISKVEDPLPCLPPALGMDNLQGPFPAALNAEYNYAGYVRPSLARLFGDSANGPPSAFLEKMRNHTWGREPFSDPDPEFVQDSGLGEGSPSNDETGGQPARETDQLSGDAVQGSEGAAQLPIGEFNCVAEDKSANMTCTGGFKFDDFDSESPEDPLTDSEAESEISAPMKCQKPRLISLRSDATVEDNGATENSEISVSTEKILHATTNVESIAAHERKREDEVPFEYDNLPTADTQDPATPACDGRDDTLAQEELRQSASPKAPKESHQPDSLHKPQTMDMADQDPGVTSDKTRDQETKGEPEATSPKRAKGRGRKAGAARANVPLRRNPPRKVRRTHRY